MDSDSDFYGDEEEIATLESRLDSFNPATYWTNRSKLPSAMQATEKPDACIKQEEAEQDSPAPATKLHNPYEGRRSCAKQLGETVEAFLARLPPATTDAVPRVVPWIFVANPFIPRAAAGAEEAPAEEAPAEFGARLATLMEGGRERLQLLGDFLRTVEEKGGRVSRAAAVGRETAKQKEGAVNDVLMLARMLKVRTGKWMLFVEPALVDDVWGTVVRATVRNELGIAAKVAPREEKGSAKQRLICIYTYDFSDRDDVARVLNRMKQLHLVRPGRNRIYYKADVFTHLGIGSGNPWGLRASIFNSGDVFSYIKSKEGKTVDGRVKEEDSDSKDWTF